MMTDFAIYKASGEIIRTGSAPGDIQMQAEDGEFAIEGWADPDTKLVDVTAVPHAIIDKPSMNLTVNQAVIQADGVDLCSISNIPAGAEVIWPDGLRETVTDGAVEFSVDLPGQYFFRLLSPLHLFEEVAIEAIAAA